jgi:putative transposase
MDAFSRDLLASLRSAGAQTIAWCVLPNHYHALVETDDVVAVLRDLGLLHGRTSHAWNGEEGSRGRRVFFRAVERAMRSERHVWATVNYVHHNPVKHRYVGRWRDWPWSSAAEYVDEMGVDEALRVWRTYPTREFGKGWDDPDL